MYAVYETAGLTTFELWILEESSEWPTIENRFKIVLI